MKTYILSGGKRCFLCVKNQGLAGLAVKLHGRPFIGYISNEHIYKAQAIPHHPKIHTNLCEMSLILEDTEDKTYR